jgi:hypothetical protein
MMTDAKSTPILPPSLGVAPILPRPEARHQIREDWRRKRRMGRSRTS